MEAMTLACNDIKEHMVHARDENEEIMQIEGYSDDLIQSLKEEKESVSELIEFMEEMIVDFQAYMEADEKEGGVNNAEKHEEEKVL